MTLHYWLASNIEPSMRFDGHTAERQPDGSHIISAQFRQREWFYAVSTLLRYGQYCRVIEPTALANEMQQIAHDMAMLYDSPPQP